MKTRKYNTAPERRSVQEQSLSVEDAEIKILKICKDAALFGYSRLRFTREIKEVIAALERELDNPDLKRRIVEPLERYALRTLEREVRLVRAKAVFFAAVMAASKRGERKARDYEPVIKREYSEELTKSPRFVTFEEKAEESFLRYNEALPLDIYHKEYTETVDEVLKELVAADAKEDYNTNVNLRNIAEMTVRYDDQLKMIDELKSNGERLAYIEAHQNCSKRCEPWQVGGSSHPSGLYSLDGTKGETPEGIPYIPLETATDITYTTKKTGKTYLNGCITGFNCRHRLVPYRPNMRPTVIPAKVIERRRKVEHEQRGLEREIRYQKRLSVQKSGIDNKAAAKARKKAKQLNEQYISFCKKNEVSYFPDRTKILDDERDFKLRNSDK
jgi:hypothetical protein